MTKDEALKLAFEALENHCGNYKLDDAGCKRWNKAVAAIKEALAQPEQEPVAINQHRVPYCADWYDGIPDHPDGHGPYEVRTLYTTPPKRPWAGLTEDEIIAVDMHTLRVRGDGYTYARAIEAKLKEKNNGN